MIMQLIADNLSYGSRVYRQIALKGALAAREKNDD